MHQIMNLFTRKNKHKDSTAASSSTPDSSLEKRTLAIGSELLEQASGYRASMLSGKAWSEKLMDFAMKDHAFKIQMFRYVDVFPTLKTPQAIHEVLTDYMSQPGVTAPPFMNAGLAAGSLAKGMVAKTITSQITSMAKNFIAGTDAASAFPKLKELRKMGMTFSVDLLGEVCVSQIEAEQYQQLYLDLVNQLPEKVSGFESNATLDTDHLGAMPTSNVSIKVSSLLPNIKPQSTDYAVDALHEALTPILTVAEKKNVLINFDMEHHALKDLTIKLFQKCCEAIDFPAGIAIQAYLRSGSDDAQKLIDWTQRMGRQITVRLIKGAYWDYETIHAEEMGWPVPVWSRKQDTDASFERMTEQLIAQTPTRPDQAGIKLALGSHNLRSIAFAKALLEQHNLPANALEYQMLEGMAENLKDTLVKNNDRVRVYIPVGQMIPGMAYLVRRLLENTSNESWLRSSGKENPSAEQLLKSPHVKSDEADPGEGLIANAPEIHELSSSHPEVGDGKPFYTEPLRDFADAVQREAFGKAINNTTLQTTAINATAEDLDHALAQASAAFAKWRDRPAVERANIIVRAADIMRQQRDTLSGIIIREAGKPWVEADADVCEAIDFCEFYARESIGLFQPKRLGKFIGELNQIHHQAIGVAGIISPWNFPLAICTGLTVAALVTGNTAIVKPAEQTPTIARIMCDILHQAGVPKDVLHFLPGEGETIGAKMVRDPRISIIGFTGSKEVGFDIINAASIVQPMQSNVKRVICEMGGKNAIIVDSTADLDEAVSGVRDSAFNFAGQKCSACSRAIVVGSAYETFVERLVEATRAFRVGDPLDATTDIGPVIDQAAAEKIKQYIEIGKEEATAAYAPGLNSELVEIEKRIGKPLIEPHIFTEVNPNARIATEEIFGPVLGVIHAETFEEALQIANDLPYKLTGAVYSRTPKHLEVARREFRVGNLYLNRGSTGALVGRQPFGGFGHSGLGTKAGGRDYLRQFVNPINVTENTMRRGFAPDLAT